MRLINIIPFAIYLFINNLFIIKYSSRVDVLNEWYCCLLYLILASVFVSFYTSYKSLKSYKFFYFLFITAFFLFSIILNHFVDGNSLNVDRWSAMDVGINALLNNEYPYSAIDHLGGRTSNLPTLFLIGIPFYLMGDVGILQSFGFLLFSFISFKIFNSYKDRLLCVLLIIFSPSYLWEIYCKSDLMTNFILVLLLMTVFHKTDLTKKKNIAKLSFFSTALILSRLTVVIPISLFLFKRFWCFSLKEKNIFGLVALLTTITFLCICFKNIGSINHFLMHNPFDLQNRQLPFFVSLITIVIPIIYSFRLKGFYSILIASFYFLLLPITLAFIINIYKYGWSESLYNSAFDISYFNIIIPFLLIVIVFNLKNDSSIKNVLK